MENHPGALLFCGTPWMVFHIFGLSGLEQAAFSHNLGQMKEALPLNSLFNYFETTPFLHLPGYDAGCPASSR